MPHPLGKAKQYFHVSTMHGGLSGKDYGNMGEWNLSWALDCIMYYYNTFTITDITRHNFIKTQIFFIKSS